MSASVSYQDFKASWLEDVLHGDPSSVQKGQRFANKLVGQWLETEESELDIVYCDGAGDGGIDIAVLERGSSSETDEVPGGDCWYLVQSKYGSAFAGETTLLTEGKKVIDTLDGRRANLSSLAAGLFEKLTNFRKQAGPQDRIVLVFATIDPLTEEQDLCLKDIASLGGARLGLLFDVRAISLKTIHDALEAEEELAATRRLTVPLAGHLANAGDDLLVGSVKLTELYDFLKAYRGKTGNNLDQLYEKNVRRFLGGRVKVNRGMRETLQRQPERFGLFNNGITIVVSEFKATGSGSYDLIEPFVVNGCQTTRTIWEVCSAFLDAGGKGKNEEIESWRKRADRGCVVTKVAKVGRDGEALLQDITRFTNSQNAVREKDFVTLESGFKAWQTAMASKYAIYLEIQRGGWDSQRAFQKQNPKTRQFTYHANAIDLVKVFGAGWLSEPGLAFGKNPPFLPGGAVFKQITAVTEEMAPFGVDDLHAAYLVKLIGEEKEFGRGGRQERRQTKFLFYFIVIHLLRDVLQAKQRPAGLRDLTQAIIKLLDGETAGGAELVDNATALIDEYMNPQSEHSYLKEASEAGGAKLDLNAFLKWEQLGRSLEKTPNLQQLLFYQKSFMKKQIKGAPSAYDVIVADLDSGSLMG
jgi:hypothetical protein